MDKRKSVLLYGGRYELFCNGDIVSRTKNWGGEGLKIRPAIVEQQRRKCKKVVLTTAEGKTVCHLLHRLVAEQFLDNPDNYPYVHAKDGDLTNCDASNLFWSQQRLSQYVCQKCGEVMQKDEYLCEKCKRKEEFEAIALEELPPENRSIIECYLNGDTYVAIGRKYGYTGQMIKDYLKGEDLKCPISEMQTKKVTVCSECGKVTLGRRRCTDCARALKRRQELYGIDMKDAELPHREFLQRYFSGAPMARIAQEMGINRERAYVYRAHLMAYWKEKTEKLREENGQK